jgi:hypothetical protein
MTTMPNESDYVPLLDVLQAVKQRHSVDDRRAQDIIRDAHRLGDLDLKIRRPNGSVEDLSRRDTWEENPWQGETWRQHFDHGIINAEYPVRWSHRRVNPSEPCHIYGVRENLDRFLGADSVAPLPPEGGRPTDRERIIDEARRRINAKEPLPSTKTAWAKELEAWLDKQPGARRGNKTRKVMTAETIEGHIQPLWNAHRRDAHRRA